jgi:hypothetical protein
LATYLAPVGNDSDKYDLALVLNLNNQALGAWYAPKGGGKTVYLYTGAMTSGTFSLQAGERTVFSHSFEKVLQKRRDTLTDTEAFMVLAAASFESPNAGGLWMLKRWEIRRVIRRELLYIFFAYADKVETLVKMLTTSEKWEDCRTIAEALQEAQWIPGDSGEKAKYYFGLEDWARLVELGEEAVPTLQLGLKESFYVDIAKASKRALEDIKEKGKK